MIAQARGKQEGVVFVLSCLHCTKTIVLPYVEACEKKGGGGRTYLFVSEPAKPCWRYANVRLPT